MPKISFPAPCLSMSVKPLKKGDEDKIISGLVKLQDEDPCFTVETNLRQKKWLFSGVRANSKIRFTTGKLKAKYNVDAALAEPRVPYRSYT